MCRGSKYTFLTFNFKSLYLFVITKKGEIVGYWTYSPLLVLDDEQTLWMWLTSYAGKNYKAWRFNHLYKLHQGFSKQWSTQFILMTFKGQGKANGWSWLINSQQMKLHWSKGTQSQRQGRVFFFWVFIECKALKINSLSHSINSK